jgi:hypothetical protein
MIFICILIIIFKILNKEKVALKVIFLFSFKLNNSFTKNYLLQNISPGLNNDAPKTVTTGLSGLQK